MLKLAYLVLIAASCFRFSVRTIRSGLDPSWSYAMNLLPKDGILWGKDVIFTYGPLGRLFGPLPMGNNVMFSLIFWCIITILTVSVFVYMLFSPNVSRLTSRRTNLFASLILLYLGAGVFKGVHSEYIISLLMLSMLVLCWRSGKYIFFIMACMLSSLSFFLKFNLTVSSILAVSVFTLLVLINNGMKSSARYFLGVLMMPIFSCLMFLAYNPSLNELIWYVKGAFEISSGYNSAMSLQIKDFREIARLMYPAYLLATSLIFLVFIKIFGVFRAKHSLSYAAIFMPFIFFLYKHSFVRIDHVPIFIPMMIVYSSVYVLFMDEELHFSLRTERIIKVFTGVIFCLTFAISSVGLEGYIVSKVIHGTGNILKLNDDYIARIKRGASNHLITLLSNPIPSAVRNIIYAPYQLVDNRNSHAPDDFITSARSGSTAVYPWEVSYVQDFTKSYKTMPIFQAYSAYTKYLDERNAEFFADSRSAPDYVIFSLQAIDNRFALLECPATCFELFRHYRIAAKASVNAEGKEHTEFLLSRDKPKDFTVTKINTLEVSRDGIISVPDVNAHCLMKMNMPLSLLGQAAKFLWKIPGVNMEVEFVDGSHISKRVLPEVMSNNMLISPLAIDDASFVAVMNGKVNTNRVKSIQFSGDGLKYYSSRINITFSELKY